jgi:hypothetical protein
MKHESLYSSFSPSDHKYHDYEHANKKRHVENHRMFVNMSQMGPSTQQ